MDLQNLSYALIQIAHNFGAVAVVGGSVLGFWPLHVEEAFRHRLAWVVLAGWVIQAASGASFGMVSYAYYGQLPDIHGIAIAALMVKIICAVSGFLLTSAYLRYSSGWSQRARDALWALLIILSVTAITAAAFLRWFS